MSKVLIDRAVVEQAQEALTLNNSEWKSLADSGDAGYWTAENQDHYKQTENSIAALRAALAEQPAEQGRMRCNTPKKCALYGCSPLTWPSEQPVEQEPCGWQFFADGRWYNGSDRYDHRKHTEDAGFPTRDVYPAPQPAKPAEQEPFTVLVRKHSWLPNQWEAAPCGFRDYGKQWADERINVYTAPQPAKREPLTREELADAWLSVEHITHATERQIAFARAIIETYERKNGIGGQS